MLRLWSLFLRVVLRRDVLDFCGVCSLDPYKSPLILSNCPRYPSVSWRWRGWRRVYEWESQGGYGKPDRKTWYWFCPEHAHCAVCGVPIPIIETGAKKGVARWSMEHMVGAVCPNESCRNSARRSQQIMEDAAEYRNRVQYGSLGRGAPPSDPFRHGRY
jgi:hypothetical protein